MQQDNRQWTKETQQQGTQLPRQSTNSQTTLAKVWTFRAFSETFNPDKQQDFCQHVERCILGTAPTLRQVKDAYHDQRNADLIWLVPQLENLAEFSGAKDKITKPQYKQLAAMIASSHPWLKVTDIMLFCWRFKQGIYGKFYGSVDPITILQALNTYERERAIIIEREQQQRRQEEYERSKRNAIPCPDILAKSIAQLLAKAKHSCKSSPASQP